MMRRRRELKHVGHFRFFDIERWPKCGKRVCSGVGESGQKLLRQRDEARCEEIKAVKYFAEMAEQATKAARASELCAWKTAAATMQRALDSEEQLERLQADNRRRAEAAERLHVDKRAATAAAAAAAAATAAPQTPPSLMR
jgi:hypothetical protein